MIQRLLVIRILRPDKFVISVQSIIAHYMDKSYTEMPFIDLVEIISQSSKIQPIIFILSTGVDPLMEV